MMRNIRGACCRLEVATAVKGAGGDAKDASTVAQCSCHSGTLGDKPPSAWTGTWRGRRADHNDMQTMVRLLNYFLGHSRI
jgi:hypothetical protein